MDDAEKLERKLVKLQKDIELLRKSRSLANAEQKASSVDTKSEFKKNSLEMKQLENEVGDLQVRLKRKQLNDFKLMQETMREKCKNPTDLKANSAKDLLEKLESRVLGLNLSCQTQLHTLKHLERTVNEENNVLKKMTETCQQDGVSSESDCLQQIRHLENAQNKTLKLAEDCEGDNDKLKRMLKNALKKQNSQLKFLVELKKEQASLAENENQKINEEQMDGKNAARDKKVKELEKLKNEVLLIKEATCCDIRDIDMAFREQKATNEDLTEMAKKAEKRLIELKEEKRNLAAKKALMKEVDSVYPKSDDKLSLAKNRLIEQQIRLDSAKEELDRTNSHTNRTKEVFQRLIIKMNPKVNKVEMNKKDVKQLSKQLENVVRFTFPSAGLKHAAKDKGKS